MLKRSSICILWHKLARRLMFLKILKAAKRYPQSTVIIRLRAAVLIFWMTFRSNSCCFLTTAERFYFHSIKEKLEFQFIVFRNFNIVLCCIFFMLILLISASLQFLYEEALLSSVWSSTSSRMVLISNFSLPE